MKKIILTGLAILSINGLSAWDNIYTPQRQYNNPYQPMSDYEQQSLEMQRQSVRNQERMIAQQKSYSRSPLDRATTSIGVH